MEEIESEAGTDDWRKKPSWPQNQDPPSKTEGGAPRKGKDSEKKNPRKTRIKKVTPIECEHSTFPPGPPAQTNPGEVI